MSESEQKPVSQKRAKKSVDPQKKIDPQKTDSNPQKPNEIEELEGKVNKVKTDIEAIRGRRCFILQQYISPMLVNDVYDDLRLNYKNLDGNLDVIVESSGGDIDAAYNIASLFQKYAHKELSFIVPRWAKSAATLIVCAGDVIYMTPVAELGPLDPQITEINPIEERMERFSPLHIQTTLEMIRQEFQKGNKDLADGLLKRLQYPLTLGSFLKTQEISQQYLVRLLQNRMEKTSKLGAKVNDIATRLSKDYVDHGFCINCAEAKNIGLNIIELEGDLLEKSWELYKIIRKISDLKKKQKEEEMKKLIEKIPPEILDKLKIGTGTQNIKDEVLN